MNLYFLEKDGSPVRKGTAQEIADSIGVKVKRVREGARMDNRVGEYEIYAVEKWNSVWDEATEEIRKILKTRKIDIPISEVKA